MRAPRRAHLLSHSNLQCPFAGHSSARFRCMSTLGAQTAAPQSAGSPVRTATRVETASAGGSVDAAEQALVPSPQPIEAGNSIPANSLAMRLPVELEVAIPLGDF